MSDLNDVLKAGGSLAPLLDRAEANPPIPVPPPPAPDGVSLRSAADAYPLEAFNRDRERRIVSLAKLPGWPHADTQGPGHGLGAELDRTIGEGIEPGSMVLISADAAGSGKTSFLHQLTDGLALRSAGLLSGAWPGEPEEALTPVVWFSEMPARLMEWRRLARWTGNPANLYRLGRSAMGTRADLAWQAGEEALSSGLMAEARRRFLFDAGDGAPFEATRLSGALSQLKTNLEAETGRPTWPVVVLDPYHRHGEPGLSEIEAQNATAEDLRREANAYGWIFMATCDTNAASARGTGQGPRTDQERAASAVRGSYKAIHVADLHLHLDEQQLSPKCNGEAMAVAKKLGWETSYDGAGDFDPPLYRIVGVVLGKNRNGPGGRFLFRWWPRLQRWEALSANERRQWQEVAEAERKRREPDEGKAPKPPATPRPGKRKVDERPLLGLPEAERDD